jgi:hypothetical protein
MSTTIHLKKLIQNAFADTPYPGNDALDPLFYLYFGLDQKTRTHSVNVPGRGVSTR